MSVRDAGPAELAQAATTRTFACTRAFTRRAKHVCALGATIVLLTACPGPKPPSSAPISGSGLSTSGSAPAKGAVDTDHDGIPDSLEMQLADKYAPVMLLHADEPNMPVSVDWLLQRASLNSYCHGYLPRPSRDPTPPVLVHVQPLTPGDLTQPPFSKGTCVVSRDLTSVDPLPDDKALGGPGGGVQQSFYLSTLAEAGRSGSLNTKDWVTYVHVYPTYDGGIMLQYWHVFSFNDYQTVANNLGSSVDQHGGDWDASVQVELDASLRPEGMWLSRHTHDAPGDYLPSDQVTWTGGSHPIVTVDAGGHAAYASLPDFCAYHAFAQNVGKAVWPRDGTAATSLSEISCPLGRGQGTLSDGPSGGTVWETWSGGRVTQSVAENLRAVPAGSTVGNIVNLGEYNPGTVDCNQHGGGPCVGLPTGAFLPR